MRKISIVLLIAIFSSCERDPFSGPVPPIEPADVILYNASILTMEPNTSAQQAIAIKGQKIIAVGDDSYVLGLPRHRRTRLIDMKRHTIMPGIVDAHTHLFTDFSVLDLDDLAEAQQLIIENGITTLGNMFATEETIEELKTFEPALKVRTSLYLAKTTNCGVVLDDWYMSYPPTRIPGEMLRIGGIKIFSDGGSCDTAAVSVERTPGGGFGTLFHTQEELNEMVTTASTAGYQVGIHAIGDRGIEQAMNSLELALAGGPNTLRHRIEHNGVLTPELIARYGELDIVPTIFGYKRTCLLPEVLPPFYQEAENAYQSLIKANPDLHVAWHGDDPAVEPVNPFVEMFSLVTRIDVVSEGGPCNPPEWLAEEALTVKQALKIMTTGSAYALDREQEVGSLRPGKYADLLVLSANPLLVDPSVIKDIQVLATMINGKVEYEVPFGVDLGPLL